MSTHMPANSVFSGPMSNKSTFNIVLTEKKIQMVKRERKKAQRFRILHYYRSFSSDIVAVKGLILDWRSGPRSHCDSSL